MIPNIPLYMDRLINDNIRRAGYLGTGNDRLLSIGRIYHTLSLAVEGNNNPDTVVICVQQYKPL